MGKIEEAFELLQSCVAAGPVSAETIDAAEEELEVRFPPSYREFLATFGAAMCSGFQIAGLFSAPEEETLWIDVMTSTLQARRYARLLPEHYVAISGDGGDYTYYLDAGSSRADGECPVVALGPGVHGVAIAEDFADFVVRIFGDRIDFQPS